MGGEVTTTTGTVGAVAVALGEDQGMLDVPLFGNCSVYLEQCSN